MEAVAAKAAAILCVRGCICAHCEQTECVRDRNTQNQRVRFSRWPGVVDVQSSGANYN